MNNSKAGRTAFWAAILTLVFAVALPTTGLAQGRGRGKSNDKCDKFVNCHDARDGRVDGRGPQSDRYDRNDRYDDRDDDVNNRNGRYRNGNYRNGGYNNTDIRRVAEQRGYDEGYRAGQDDRNSGRSRDYSAHRTYQDASAGYNNNYGNFDQYRRYFQEAYRQGYNDGYRGRNSSGSGRSRVGSVLGGIFGRP